MIASAAADFANNITLEGTLEASDCQGTQLEETNATHDSLLFDKNMRCTFSGDGPEGCEAELRKIDS